MLPKRRLKMSVFPSTNYYPYLQFAFIWLEKYYYVICNQFKTVKSAVNKKSEIRNALYETL